MSLNNVITGDMLRIMELGPDSPRWCGTCDAYGDHHTDRHPSGGSHIALFAGVDMTGIAAEAAGFKTIATAEMDPWCRKVLEQRNPNAIHYADVKHVAERDTRLRTSVQRPLLISGGFPCQDVSAAGTGLGLAGARSGLWSEFARIIGEFRPEYVLIENSPMLRKRGLDRVLADLETLGYDAEWDCIPAAAVGAPHMRDRIFIVAVPSPAEGGRDYTEFGSDYFGYVAPAGCFDGHGEPVTALPRSGRMVSGILVNTQPRATIKAAKTALLAHNVPCPATPTGGWPTPAASNPQDGEGAASWLARREKLRAKHVNGNGAGMPLSIAVNLYPTPLASFRGSRGRDSMRKGGGIELPLAAKAADMDLWPIPEGMTRSAWVDKLLPTPTKSDGSGGPGTTPKRTGGPNLRTVVAASDGNGRLNPEWVEWMMGLPRGWTDPETPNDALDAHEGWQSEHGIARTADARLKDRTKRIKALGNGLVPQAAAVALTMIDDLLGAIQ